MACCDLYCHEIALCCWCGCRLASITSWYHFIAVLLKEIFRHASRTLVGAAFEQLSALEATPQQHSEQITMLRNIQSSFLIICCRTLQY